MKLLKLFIYSKQPVIRIGRHVVFWATDILSWLSIVSINREVNVTEVASLLMKMTPIICITYFILYYLIPTFSEFHDRGKLILWILAILGFIGIGMRTYNFYVVNPILGISQDAVFNLLDIRLTMSTIFSYMAVICMAITIKLVKNKSELEQINSELQREKKIAELNFLKAQMQPHFLFNTLNTLYSETIQESGKAEKIVLHLSNLLRFILDECNKPYIELSKEIRVIRDFVALEQMRHSARLNVLLKTEGVDENALVSPLTFLPFVENSFKHTLLNQAGKVDIIIIIETKNNEVNLFVENELAGSQVRPDGTGKGITNVRNQLDLLYGKNYTLKINGADKKFSVSLSVPLQTQSRNA